MSRNPIILALDVDNAAEAQRLVQATAGTVGLYKVGLELYAAAGMEFVRHLVGGGHGVFLDLKFYDIPETVRRAVSRVAATGVRFLTIHGSTAVMQAAVEGKGTAPLQLLAVTVLTSFDRDDLADLGFPCEPAELVKLRVRKAVQSGLDGVVCSPREAAEVRAIAGPRAVLVTPGVRSPGAATGDQKRVATPAEAIRAGANYLVLGRQLTRAADPRAAAEAVLRELAVAGVEL